MHGACLVMQKQPALYPTTVQRSGYCSLRSEVGLVSQLHQNTRLAILVHSERCLPESKQQQKPSLQSVNGMLWQDKQGYYSCFSIHNRATKSLRLLTSLEFRCSSGLHY